MVDVIVLLSLLLSLLWYKCWYQSNDFQVNKFQWNNFKCHTNILGSIKYKFFAQFNNNSIAICLLQRMLSIKITSSSLKSCFSLNDVEFLPTSVFSNFFKLIFLNLLSVGYFTTSTKLSTTYLNFLVQSIQ